MADVLYTIARYLIVILFACFVCVSFNVQRERPLEKLKNGYNRQRVLIVCIHALAFLCIAIKVYSGKAADTTLAGLGLFYLAQLAYILIIACVLPRALPLSRALNNCMVMFLATGLIIQTRLGFQTALRHFLLILAGTVLYIIFSILIKKVNFARNLKWAYCIAGVVLLVMVLVLAGVSGGAKTYLDLGFVTFQPLEFVKILFVLFVASFFYKDKSFKTVIITGIFAAAHVLILVACNDLGGALILAVLYVLMVYVAKKDWKILMIGLAGFCLAAVCAYFLFSHVRIRITAWLDPFSDVANTGYQIAQSLFAIGTGGWFGLGLYGGSPKSIPEVTNDMVFSAIAEEMGVIFAIMLIFLWLAFMLMIIRISLRVSNIFYKLVCFGMGLAFGVQVFLNIGGAVKFIPLTGVNLPFISSGGSSIFASMIMIGIVQALYVISEVDVELEKEALRERLAAESGIVKGRFGRVSQIDPGQEEKSYGAAAGYAANEDEAYGSRTGKVKQVSLDEGSGGEPYISDYDFEEESFEKQVARKVREVSEENRRSQASSAGPISIIGEDDIARKVQSIIDEDSYSDYYGSERDYADPYKNGTDTINIIGRGSNLPEEKQIDIIGKEEKPEKVKQIDPEDF